MDVNSNIKKTFESLNKYFIDRNINNKVLVLDFSHFTKTDESRSNIKVLLYGYKGPVELYKLAMAKAAGQMPWKKFKEPIVKKISNYESPLWHYKNEEKDIIYAPPAEYYPDEFTENNFEPKVITNTLINGPGNSILFLGRSVNNDEAQSVVYATLKNRIELQENVDSFDFRLDNKRKLPLSTRKLLEECFEYLEKLLIDEMVHSLYESWRQSEFEKQKIEVREKERELIFRRLFHSQKQFIIALDYIIDEICRNQLPKIRFVQFVRDNISDFLDILMAIQEGNLDEDENTNINEVIDSLINMFTVITSNESYIKKSFKIQSQEHVMYLKDKSLRNDLFKIKIQDGLNECKINSSTGLATLILKERLVNAITYSRYDNPEVGIELSSEGNFIIIKISSNRYAKDDQYAEIQNPTKDTQGTRIIKELCAFANWEYLPARDSMKKTTSIIFKIPK